MDKTATARWTADQVRNLGVTAPLVVAYKVVFGGSKNTAWKAYHANELPFRTLRVGRRVVVPTADLLRLLGLDTDP